GYGPAKGGSRVIAVIIGGGFVSLALLAVLSIAAVTFLGRSASSKFTSVGTVIGRPPHPTYPPPPTPTPNRPTPPANTRDAADHHVEPVERARRLVLHRPPGYPGGGGRRVRRGAPGPDGGGRRPRRAHRDQLDGPRRPVADDVQDRGDEARLEGVRGQLDVR